MSPLSYSFVASAAFSFLASSAFADLSAQDVWSDMKATTALFGYGVTGDATQSENGLTIDDLRIKLRSGDRIGDFLLDSVVLTEQSDGTVSLALPDLLMIKMTAATEGILSLNVNLSEANLIASGVPEAIQYDYSAQEISLQSSDFDADGKAPTEHGISLGFALEDMTGRFNFEPEDQHRYENSWQAEKLHFQLEFKDLPTGGSIETSGQVRELSGSISGVLPNDDIDQNNLSAAMLAGYAVENSVRFATSASQINLDLPTGKAEVSAVGGRGENAYSFDKNGVIFESKQSDFQGDFSIPQLPMPIQFSTAGTNFSGSFPILASETVDNYSFGVALNGFEMSEGLWGLFDPSGQLPRDPATIALDLSGKLKLLLNFLDPSAVDSFEAGTSPVEMESLDINRLEVSAAGAELTGTGAFEFENTQFGPPKPAGSVDLALSGGNGLIDKLVAIGLLPEQQAMAARLMMGLLTVPGEAPDTMSSKIEINKDGHVTANGQRFK